MTDTQPPDTVVSALVDRTGAPVRVFVVDGEVSIPTEPYDGISYATTTVPLHSFEARVDSASIEDGGMTLMAMLHLSDREWSRLCLDKQWEADDAVTYGEQRMLDVWAARESGIVPDDRRNIPFGRATVEVSLSKTPRGLQKDGPMTVEVGEIAAVEPLDTLIEEPVRRETELPDPPAPPELDWEAIGEVYPTEEVLEAVYIINKHAKRFATKASEAYEQGRGAKARAYSLQKDALYTTKSVVLHGIVKAAPHAVDTEWHRIDGTPFLSLSVDGWSFHQPSDSVTADLLECLGEVPVTRATARSIEYDADEAVEQSDPSIVDALRVLNAVGVNANDYLAQTEVVHEAGYWTIEWQFLSS